MLRGMFELMVMRAVNVKMVFGHRVPLPEKPGRARWYRKRMSALALARVQSRPASTQGPDQRDAGRQLAAANIEVGALRGIQRGLRGDHVEVTHGARLVLVGRQIKRLAGGAHRVE